MRSCFVEIYFSGPLWLVSVIVGVVEGHTGYGHVRLYAGTGVLRDKSIRASTVDQQRVPQNRCISDQGLTKLRRAA